MAWLFFSTLRYRFRMGVGYHALYELRLWHKDNYIRIVKVWSEKHEIGFSRLVA